MFRRFLTKVFLTTLALLLLLVLVPNASAQDHDHDDLGGGCECIPAAPWAAPIADKTTGWRYVDFGSVTLFGSEFEMPGFAIGVGWFEGTARAVGTHEEKCICCGVLPARMCCDRIDGECRYVPDPAMP